MDTPSLGRVEINVIKTDRQGGDGLQRRRQRVDQAGVDPLGGGGKQDVAALSPLGNRFRRQDGVSLIEGDIVSLPD